MDYHYEALDHQGFQKLCQALLLSEKPDTQCLPVEQPDGGRDAYALSADSDQAGFVVFQVKFSLAPDTKAERDTIQQVIRSEQGKVEDLIRRGATHYYLLTNVRGTAHLDSGSIDKAHALLQQTFGIPAQVWWRDDLDRRLDNSPDIKWSYPQILKATDLVPLLLKRREEEEDLGGTQALRSYMAAQCAADRDVKFKQVDLRCSLSQLFVDLPLGHKQTQLERAPDSLQSGTAPSDPFQVYVDQLGDTEYDPDEDNPFPHSGLAAAFFLQMPIIKGTSKFVLEGAPGQGKSTVTQFLCQVNRLRLLGNQGELQSLSNMHTAAPTRVPFRVDLRDFAVWTSGRHPYSDEATMAQGDPRSLESFLTMQINWHSGGLEFTPDDFLRIVSRSHAVLVLDGLDEVANLATRAHIVQEICEAAIRLDVHAQSLQLIVTSRPAAFANSPAFPEDDWTHLELLDLGYKNIESYTEKWIRGQALAQQESTQISQILTAKLEQPHLRDLARNPMQLSILLHLIHVQGVALPEKRTALYEEYVKHFFNREAEKSSIVRDHRELLLSIHGLIAWTLHTEAEDGKGSGGMSQEHLCRRVEDYLKEEEHDASLARMLLAGAVERVCALVSRVEGTLEFEVQPLREYFAARHLYITAPYSPAGHLARGTRPERFRALARSFYWTNVTRFFCGFYDVGELSGLVDEITALGEDEQFGLVAQPRVLAMMLLSDRVFSQTPKPMRRLIAFLMKEPGFQRYLFSTALFREADLALPSASGREELFAACREKLEKSPDSVHRGALCSIMAENAGPDALRQFFLSRFGQGTLDPSALRDGYSLGVLDCFSSSEISDLSNRDADVEIEWLLRVGRHDEIAESSRLLRLAIRRLLMGSLQVLPYRSPFRTHPVAVHEALRALLRSRGIARLLSARESLPAISVVLGRSAPQVQRTLQQWAHADGGEQGSLAEELAPILAESFSARVGEWRDSLGHWDRLVNWGMGECEGSALMVEIAVLASSTRADADAGKWDSDGFTPTKGLARRLFFARHMVDDHTWWSRTLPDLEAAGIVPCLSVLLSWGTADLIHMEKDQVQQFLGALPLSGWMQLQSSLDLVAEATEEQRAYLPVRSFHPVGTLSPELAFPLLNRIEDRKEARELGRSYLAVYDGDNPVILRMAERVELEDVEADEVDWDHLAEVSRRGRQSGRGAFCSVSRSLAAQIPEKVAISVLEECGSHSGPFVKACNQAYSSLLAQETPRLSETAACQHWFDPPQ